MSAVFIRVTLNTACFGFVVEDGRVVECAPYGRRMVGPTAATARAYLQTLPRESWAVLDPGP